MDRNEQTEAVFKSSRTEVDPVSGNEAPPGATAEEVRDDIPAMLSENEYVVPADVVRYFGVRFFEDLRNKAKEGMVELEQGGRIGGEPLEGEDDDDLPFDISELEVIDEPDEEAEVGFAAGGAVIDPSVAYMDVPDFLSGTSSTDSGGDEYKTFRNASGLIMNVRFVNGKPMSYIPPGFKEQGTATEDVAEAVTTEAPTSSSVNTPFRASDGPANESNAPIGRAASSANSAEEAAPEAPSYGMTGGKIGSGVVGAALGSALGPTAAVTGGMVGAQAGRFNDARNDLAQAVIANDAEAIEAAKEAVTVAHAKLGLGAKAVTFNEGKTANEAIANVMADVQNFLGLGSKKSKEATTAAQTPPSLATPSTVSQDAVNAAVAEAMGYSTTNPNTGRVSTDPEARFNETGQVKGKGWSGVTAETGGTSGNTGSASDDGRDDGPASGGRSGR